jgi:hypothetical protein
MHLDAGYHDWSDSKDVLDVLENVDIAAPIGKRRLMLASLRYLDTFVKTDSAWLFADRLEQRELS